jgi:hypothetical protein
MPPYVKLKSTALGFDLGSTMSRKATGVASCFTPASSRLNQATVGSGDSLTPYSCWSVTADHEVAAFRHHEVERFAILTDSTRTVMKLICGCRLRRAFHANIGCQSIFFTIRNFSKLICNREIIHIILTYLILSFWFIDFTKLTDFSLTCNVNLVTLILT